MAGPRATTVGQLVKLSATHMGRREPVMIPPRVYSFLHPLLVRMPGARRRRALQQMRVFFPYFSSRVRYGNKRTTRRLGAEPPRVERYYDRLIDFASDAHWGRKRVARPGRRERARRTAHR